MYLCFQEEDKRSAYPEESLIGMDENGFTLKSLGGTRSHGEMTFLKLKSFQGNVQNFTQALGWLKKAPKRVQIVEEFENSAGLAISAAPAPNPTQDPACGSAENAFFLGKGWRMVS